MQTQPRSAPRAYHHGDLRQALVGAALDIAAERGLEKVTVREAGVRAGVSSGAPFRHFPTKTALMTAVAEEAMRRFRTEIGAELAATTELSPMARFEALGRAYLAWALKNPTHFQVISARELIDFESSETLVRLNDEIRAMMRTLLAQAAAAGEVRPADPEVENLVGRALVYGLARMWTDGHFAQWGGEANAADLMGKALEHYASLMRR
jgi:AcrR family transcriptional regulator